MFKRVQYQFDRIGQCHHESCHIRVSYGQSLTRTNLLYKQRNYRPTRRHNITVSGTTNYSFSLIDVPGLRHHNLFHHCL
ncbi:hypothetical protein D3C76_1302730 [compost metagenome]